MKHIAFLNSLPFWGGGEKLIFEYALALAKQGYEVLVICHQGSPLAERAESSGLDTAYLKVGNLSFLNPLKVGRLSRILTSYKIDTLIFTTSQDAKLGGLVGFLSKIPRRVYYRGIAVPIKNTIVNRKLFTEWATHLIANSEATKSQMLKNHSYFDSSQIEVCYHGFDFNRFKTNERLPVIDQKGKGIILGNAGRLTTQKGQDMLIQVAQNLVARGLEFTLFIAGTGELEESLLEQIEKYNLQDKVILLGFISDMNAFMQSIDIFLLSSKWEGFGFVLVEAMLKAKPIVGFKVSSNPEVVPPETGFLVDFPDVDAFAEKTAALVEDGALRAKMGKDGKKWVENEYELTKQVQAFEQLLLN